MGGHAHHGKVTDRLRGLSRNAPLVALCLVVAIAVGLRIYVLTTHLMRLEGDEGVTAVMAQNILRGEFPVYFGIQSYQGALEQYLQALVLWALPDGPFVLRLVQVALVALILVATYSVATIVTSSRWGGVLAAALLAVGPYYFLWKGLKSHGGYGGALLAGLVMVLAALMLSRKGRRRNLLTLVLGIAAGVAVWENPTSLYLVIPAAVWAIGSARGALLRLLPWGVSGLVIGIVPMLVHIARTGVVLPTGSNEQPATSIVHRARDLFEPVLGDFLGVNGTVANAYSPFSRTITVIAILVLLGALWHRRRGLWDLLRLRRGRRKPIDLILFGLAITPVLYSLSPFTWFTAEPRYLFTAYPFVAIAVATGLVAIRANEFRVAAVTTVLIGSTFLPYVALTDALRGQGTIVATRSGAFHTEDLPEVDHVLRDEGVRTAYANVWLAGPLQFATGGEVLVGSGWWTHFPDAERRVRESRSPAVVVPTEPAAAEVRRLLKRSGRAFREAPAGRFTVFTRITPGWHPASTSYVFVPG